MKRGDTLALLLFVLQAGLAFWYARGLESIIPPLGDSYFHVTLSPLKEALSGLRTLGYPLFHVFVASQGQGLTAYPEAQLLILIPCVFVFALGLRAYGLSGLAALAAASPLLWIVPVEQVIPETLAKCFAIAAAGCLLWAAGTRSAIAYLGLALTVFLAFQMRPAFLFLVAWVPAAWLFLYARRWGLHHQAHWLRHALRTALACTIPLLLFCLFRLAIVGHFGLVSFGGQNTIGIAIELMVPATVDRLPPEDRPMARLLARGREAWPAPRFITPQGPRPEWARTAEVYAANVNRITRSTMAKFPAAEGKMDNVALDKALSRVSLHTFEAGSPLYLAWLSGAAIESLRMAFHLLLGGGGGEGFGLGPHASISLLLVLIALTLLSWPVELRAFGPGSRPYFSRAATVLLFVAGTFFLSKMLLVILVEPPLARYVEAAAFLLPCVFAALFWDRAVVLTAALCKRPHWYGACYATYPAIPDTPHALPWRDYARRIPMQRRPLLAAGVVLVLATTALIWTTRDNRLFHALEHDPSSVKSRLMVERPPVTWRSETGATLLHYAALHGDTELVKHLLAQGADAQAITDDGASALHWAAMGRGEGGAIVFLLAAGLNPDTSGPLGLNATHLASLFGRTEVVRTLLAGGGNPNAHTVTGITPLHLAGSITVAETLLQSAAAVDSADTTGATPFIWAHTRDLATLLKEHGANINVKENWWSFVRGCTPLTKAVYQNDLERARWLLDQGGDPNAGDLNNLSPVYYAIWRKNIPMLHLLLDRGADPNHLGRWAEYRSEAISANLTDIFLKIVEKHPKRHSFPRLVPDKATMHPLDWAAFIGYTDAMEILLQRGANLENRNNEGMSSLHWAVLGNQRQAEAMLRKRDPDLGRLHDTRLPVEEFRAAIMAGHRGFAERTPTGDSGAAGTDPDTNTTSSTAQP
jgi:ankyrin repeat protein